MFEKIRKKLEELKEVESNKCNKFAELNMGDQVIKYNHGEYCYLNAINVVNQVEQEYNNRFEPMIDAIEYGAKGYNLQLEQYYRRGYEDGKKESGDDWISCSDRLPKDFQRVLATVTHFEQPLMMYLDDGQWYEEGSEAKCLNRNVLAWQPLPKPYMEKVNE